ncbi:hypothetical protein CQW23_25812 [Capsicum baccatum]|uniref:Uncharacterized protein n=1 Tax=Capsicum baccatum TaxID=33114 RepID=A0A2G2VM27_CAPBA|nr:hypothetical protein CQW23_25812 [Capsicum baccatum]
MCGRDCHIKDDCDALICEGVGRLGTCVDGFCVCLADGKTHFINHKEGKKEACTNTCESSKDCLALQCESGFATCVGGIVGKKQVCLGFAGGRVLTWGRGTSGQLGHGEMVNCLHPKSLESLEGIFIKHASAGWNHSGFVSGFIPSASAMNLM